MHIRCGVAAAVLFILCVSIPGRADSELQTAFIGGTIAGSGGSPLMIDGHEVTIDDSGHCEYRFPLETASYVRLGPGEDHSISPGANSLMLWSTPARVSADGWFKGLLDGRAAVADCDPAQHVRPGLPPMIFFQGTNDNTVPAWTTEEFAKMMVEAGNRCDLHMYEDQTHMGWRKNSSDVYNKMDEFLISIGFLIGPGQGGIPPE